MELTCLRPVLVTQLVGLRVLKRRTYDARWACKLLFDLHMLVAPHELFVCCVALGYTGFDCAFETAHNSMAFLRTGCSVLGSCADYCSSCRAASSRSATVDLQCNSRSLQ